MTVEQNEVEHLYTVNDVKRIREMLYNLQNGIDPILKEPFSISGACTDHDHVTQNVRSVLHRQVNAFEGKIQNAYIRCLKWMTDKPLPEILRNLADYYEADYSKNPIHTGFIKRLCTDFASLNEVGKKDVLQCMNQPQGNNATERKAIFRKALLTKKFTYEDTRNLINETKGK